MKLNKLQKMRYAPIINKFIFLLLFLYSFLFTFTACENLIGLGKKVNTDDPRISSTEDGAPGSFLSGSDAIIYLELEAPGSGYVIDKALMDIEWKDENGFTHKAQIEGEYIESRDDWAFKINSEEIYCTECKENHGISDGQIKTNVTAIDSSGRKTITTDMIYTIKNLPPQIEMAIPAIKGRDFDSIDFILNEYLPEQDPIFVGFDLMGLATDDLGIKKGYPKIMIWPVNEDDGTENPKPGKWNHWRSAQVNSDRHGLTTKRFNWPMKVLIQDSSDHSGWRLPVGINEPHRPLDPGNYRFKLWTKDTKGCTDECYKDYCKDDDIHGTENFYPHRTNNERGTDGKAEVPNNLLKKFIEIKYVNQELPIVTFMSVPSYFNSVGYINDSNTYIEDAYTVYVTITSTQEVLQGSVKGWITDSPDIDPVFSSPEYDLIFDPTLQNVNRWVLKINKTQADAWYTQTNPLLDDNGKNREELTLFVNVRATNVNGDSSPPMSPRNFIFDKKPPTVTFDRPVMVPSAFAKGTVKSGSYEILYPLKDNLNPMPRWVTGLITAGGSNLDGSILSRIYYHIGYLGDDSPHGITREEIYKNANWIDTELNRNGIPADEYGGSWSGTLYTWNYQNNFNEWGRHKNCLTPCSYSLCGKLKNLIQEHIDLVDVDGSNYTTLGRSRFYLPFYVKVVDAANNFHIIQYKLCIDPDLDIPYADISTPAPDNTGNIIIGGEVSLSGMAADNDWIHSVQIRIKKYGTPSQLRHTNLVGDANGDPFIDPNPPVGSVNTFKYYRPYRHNAANEASNLIQWVYYNADNGKIGLPVNSSFPVPQDDPNTIDSKAGWFNAEKRNNDMVIGWYFNINTWGGLDPEDGEKMVPVRIEVRAVDSKNRGQNPGVVGASTIIDVQFSSGVPTISNPIIKKQDMRDRDYFEGITASGRFDVLMDVSDDERLMNIRVSINGKRFDLLANYINLSSNASNKAAGIAITDPKPEPPVSGTRQVSKLSIDVNTLIGSDLYTNLGYGKTGIIILEVEVHDNSTPTYITRTKFTIGVDNYYPTTSIETASNASGKQFELSGLASDTGKDSGTLQEMARVLVYFEDLIVSEAGTYDRTGIYRNPRGIINRSTADGNLPGQEGQQDSWYSDRSAIYNSTENSQVSGNWDLIPAMETYTNARPQGSSTITWGQEFKNFPVLREIIKGSGANTYTVWESPHAMVIDSHELSEDLDTDGTLGEAWTGMVEKTWRAWLDTRNFKDGPYKVHYIVMDAAGNAAHTTKDIFIENNKPLINWINLGTNIRGTAESLQWNGFSDSGDFMKVRYSIEGTASGNRIITFIDTMDSPFRVRGNRLALRIETSKGNGDKFYTVSYVTPSNIINANAMVRGQVYTIVAAGTTDWEKYGAVNNSNLTTFVASGPGEGTGMVLSYTIHKSTDAQQLDQSSTEIIGENNVTYQSRLNDIVFSDFTSIPDSQKVTASGLTQGDILRPLPDRPANWPTGWDLYMPERFFIIKVYDSTVPDREEKFQLAHAVLVALDIDNKDEKAPKINPAEFGRKYALPLSGGNIDNEANRIDTPVTNYTENIVMLGNSKQGYVQYKEHNGKTMADISGQVIFTGKASDNQRIQNIKITIPGFLGDADGGEFTAAEWKTLSGKNELHSNRTVMGGGGDGTDKWYFIIKNQSVSLEYGHTINWEFGWDSSYITNQVGTPTVKFMINDHRTIEMPVDSNMNVNIVPYISEITTPLSGAYGSAPSAFARSANGWYPARDNQEITIKGFNLGSGTASSRVSLPGLAAGNNLAGSVTRNQIIANLTDACTSGDLTVTVSNVKAINNDTVKMYGGNKVDYNWEPNNVNNNILTNDRKIYVWTVGTIKSTGTEAYDPLMSVSKSGYRYLVLSNGTNGDAFRFLTNHTDIANNGTALGGGSQNRFINFGLAIDTYTTNNNWYVVSSNQTGGQENFAFLHARGAPSQLNSSATSGTNKAQIFSLGASNANPNRLLIPKLHARNDTVTLSYGDGTASNAIRLHVGTVSGATGSTQVNGTASFGGGYRDAGNAAYVQNISDGSSTYKGSAYTASASLSTGQPVIAWYDETLGSERLLFSYGNRGTYNSNNAHNMSVARWNNRAAIVHGKGALNSRPTGAAGADVDMAVDENDNVHLAYYDVANGGLYYAHITNIPDTDSNSTSDAQVTSANIQVVKVDTFLSAGTKIKISVRKEMHDTITRYVPYITYYHGSFTNTRNSIRVAWRSDWSAITIPAGTDESDMFTGSWEVMTVPVNNVPDSRYFVCNGVPETTTNWAPLTTGANRLGNYAAINKSIIVGYMTRGAYEGAILKRDLY